MDAAIRFVRNVSFVAFCMVAVSASAGTKTNAGVFINDAVGYAAGSLDSARSSADTLQFISCDLYATGNIQCKARNSAGVLRTCSTSDAAFVKTVQMINQASYVAFWWDTSGNCTSMLVRNGSNYLP
jgi:hypothetical protein